MSKESRPESRRTSATSAVQQASRSILGKNDILSLEDLLVASKENLMAQVSPKASPKTGLLTLQALQLQFLREAKINPAVTLSSLAVDPTEKDSQHLEKLQAEISKLTKQIAELEKQVADSAKLHAEQQQQATLMSSAHTASRAQDLDSIKTRLENMETMLRDSSKRAGRSSEGADLVEDNPCNLRFAGVTEEAEETEESLLNSINDVLDQLSSKVQATGARRQGRPGKKGRAAIVTFAGFQDRINVLRTKAELNKIPELKQISIDVVLNPDEQKQKNALWPVYVQARRNNQKAVWRGCILYINGQDSRTLMNIPPADSGANGLLAGLPAMNPSSLPPPPPLPAYSQHSPPQPAMQDWVQGLPLNPLYHNQQQQQHYQQPRQHQGYPTVFHPEPIAAPSLARQ